MKNKNMNEIEILTQTLNEMITDGTLNLISKNDKNNHTGVDLYVTASD